MIVWSLDKGDCHIKENSFKIGICKVFFKLADMNIKIFCQDIIKFSIDMKMHGMPLDVNLSYNKQSQVFIIC